MPVPNCRLLMGCSVALAAVVASCQSPREVAGLPEPEPEADSCRIEIDFVQDENDPCKTYFDVQIFP